MFLKKCRIQFFNRQMFRRSQKGFTVIELLIVLIILALLAYIALPNLIHAYISINEKSVKTALRTFHTANEAFKNAQNPPVFASKVDELIHPPSRPPYLDSSWGRSLKHGYKLIYAGGGGEHAKSYSLVAIPAILNRTGKNAYCIDQKGILVSANGQGESVLKGSPEGCEGGSVVLMG